MKGGALTAREAEIIDQLLAERGITTYEIVQPTGEGKELPWSTFAWEIESLSGTIVTETTVYGFWLDWINGTYTLGEPKGYWFEVPVEEMLDPDDVLEAQHRLREKL